MEDNNKSNPMKLKPEKYKIFNTIEAILLGSTASFNKNFSILFCIFSIIYTNVYAIDLYKMGRKTSAINMFIFLNAFVIAMLVWIIKM